MTTAFVNYQRGAFPLEHYFGDNTRYRFVLGFSKVAFDTGVGTLATRPQFMVQEDADMIPLRNYATGNFTKSLCPNNATTGEFLMELAMTTGNPSVATAPSSTGLFIVMSDQTPSDSWRIQHTSDVASTATTLVFVISNIIETNFDWLLFPNEIYVPSTQTFHSGSSVSWAIDTPVPGSTTVTVTGMSGLPGGAFAFRLAGFELAIIEEFDAIVPTIGVPFNVDFTIKSGPFPEVVL